MVNTTICLKHILQITRDDFENTISSLNQMYAEAEQVTATTYCEGCFACLTGYLLFLCVDTHYSKVIFVCLA